LTAHIATWVIAALATCGVILRPFRLAEAVWAVLGAAALVVLGLLPASVALRGIFKGLDVYLFLIGMMLLAEMAREEGLFDWLAARAVSWARGSAVRLFSLIYIVGIVVTAILSNDATAVVLTPAVVKAARAAKIERPLPYLYVCAFIANAASFILPISNPANLVIFGDQMPPLSQWLTRFALPSVLSVGVTYALLRYSQRAELAAPIQSHLETRRITAGGLATAIGIVATAIALATASATGQPLGLPTCLAALLTMVGVCMVRKNAPWRYFGEMSWGVIPLVGGLFVLVEALDGTGLIRVLGEFVGAAMEHSVQLTAIGSGLVTGFGSNLLNNLPAGLIAGSMVHAAHLSTTISSGVVIGIDLGPNLSVTGSLATILWLVALRRGGIRVDGWQFLKVGMVVMPPALLLALAAALI
jgi:arsenical pump membrane protein